jgi:hypothetical protein
MRTQAERLVFLPGSAASMGLAAVAARRLVRIIARGQGRPDWMLALRRLPDVANGGCQWIKWIKDERFGHRDSASLPCCSSLSS